MSNIANKSGVEKHALMDWPSALRVGQLAVTSCGLSAARDQHKVRFEGADSAQDVESVDGADGVDVDAAGNLDALIDAMGRAVIAGEREKAGRLHEQAVALLTAQADDVEAYRRGFDRLLLEGFTSLCAVGDASEVAREAARLRGRAEIVAAGLARAAEHGRLDAARLALAALPDSGERATAAGAGAGNARPVNPERKLADAIEAVARLLRDGELEDALVWRGRALCAVATGDAIPASSKAASVDPTAGEAKATDTAAARRERQKAEARRSAWRAIAAECMRRMALDPSQRRAACALAVAMEPLCPGLMAAYGLATAKAKAPRRAAHE
ncbi:hypothetical protein LA345_13195 [Burkholderia vietnamiensis]|uniref:Uncharacterized protein n=1 Tax=Burkholderia vietnamiensis (strain G4 / LMG 22486) TaxID=269482 RepID=A4JFQ6_BURVG|nr:hypothetical protein Bcep1808_2107 [Burkholderia vietnamiensis G4]MCB4344869.1 hypothetical protein [Burkholderia vietnamiensis]